MMDTKQKMIKNPKSKGGLKKLFSISAAPGRLVELVMLDAFMLNARFTMRDIDHEVGIYSWHARVSISEG